MTCASLMHVLLVCALVLGSAFVVVADTDGIVYNECPEEDIGNITVSLAHEKDCTKYYQCIGGKKYLKECPTVNLEGKKLYFNPILQVCDWPQNVNCKQPKPSSLTNLKIDIPTKCPKFDSIHFTVHLAHETDCTKFYTCTYGKKVEMDCPLANVRGDKLHFNAELQVCDWPENAGCQTSDHTTPSSTTSSSTTPSSTTHSSTTPSSTTSSSTTSSSTTPSSTTPSSTTPSSTTPSSTTPSSTTSSSTTPSSTTPSSTTPSSTTSSSTTPSSTTPSSTTPSSTTPSSTTPSSTTSSSTTPSSTTSSSTTPSPTTPSSTTSAFINSSCMGTCPSGSDLTYIPTLPHKEQCTKYCLCMNGIAHVMDCPSGLSYDELKGICNFPSDGECDVGTTPETPTPETPTPEKPTPETPTPEKPTAETPTPEKPTPETPTPKTPTPETPTPETPTPETPTPKTPTPETPTPKTPTPETPTPETPTSCKGTCPIEDDLTYIPTLPHNEDCTKYCLCVNGIGHVMDCPSGLSYNELKGICDFSSDGECDVGTTPGTPGPETPTPKTPTPETPTPETPTPETPTLETPTPKTPTPETPTPETPTPETPTPETPTPETPTPETPISCKGTCPIESDSTYIPTLPHKEDCTKYCLCVNGIGHVMDCPSGLSYDESKGICDFPSDSECDVGTTPETPGPETPTPETPTPKTPTPKTPTPETPTPETPTPETPTPETPTPETPTPETPTPETPTPETPTPETPTPETPTPETPTPETPTPETPTPETPTPETPTPETPTPETPTPETPTPETPTPETPTPETPTPPSSTPEIPSSNGCIGSCPRKDPLYAIHLPNEECTKFCECSNGEAYVFTCPSGLHFSPTLSVCTRPREAKCANGKYRPKP